MNTFKKIRERLKLTQSALAKILGVTQGNVSHYEQGQVVPVSIAKLLIAHAKELGHEITFDDVYAEPKKSTSKNRGGRQPPNQNNLKSKQV